MERALRRIRLSEPELLPLAEKVARGARLDRADALRLMRARDLVGLGRLADAAARRRTGDDVYYVFNRQVNPTNLCVLSCAFCDFAAKPGDAHAYEMSMEDVLARVDRDVREVHIVGGLWPAWGYQRYVDIVAAIRRAHPTVTIKAWTAVEIDFLARLGKRPVAQVLEELRAAGLDALPGGGAEVFSERVKAALFPQKIGAERWLEIHRAAHRLGILSNATLLYGHVETIEERVDHMLRLRALQDETGGFLAFIPLAYQLGETKLVARAASAPDDLRTIATSRLLLDNFVYLKAYWVMLGLETAALALRFGANDVDGTIGGEKIAHLAGAASPVELTRQSVVRLIRDAGKVPVERDALYRPVQAIAPAGTSAPQATGTP
ncbi:MAG TPA: aminofutalosine synthase MqnE [Myxococcota bacterium]|jgi:aminodeoxyfutalosine synthase|nr:aminofutalosine synthase MqnE [Myxococcota bacterium]